MRIFYWALGCFSCAAMFNGMTWALATMLVPFMAELHQVHHR